MTERAQGAGRHSTAIGWTHIPGYRGDVWNPTTGCTRVSEGCNSCYAFALHDQRYAVNRRAAIREAGDASPETYAALRARDAGLPRAERALPWPPQYDQPFSTVQLLPQRLEDPLHAAKPRCYFVDSMADLFHEDVPDDYLDAVFATMALTPRHLYLILTKRPERMRGYVRGRADGYGWVGKAARLMPDWTPNPQPWPLPNVWLGVSVESQPYAAPRLDVLLDTPAAVRFVSAEPLLGPLDLSAWLEPWECRECGYSPGERGVWTRPRRGCPVCSEDKGDEGWIADKPHLDWVIAGGESGAHFRPMEEAWASGLSGQCRGAGVAFFMKQVSARRPGTPPPAHLARHEWPIRTADGGWLTPEPFPAERLQPEALDRPPPL